MPMNFGDHDFMLYGGVDEEVYRERIVLSFRSQLALDLDAGWRCARGGLQFGES